MTTETETHLQTVLNELVRFEAGETKLRDADDATRFKLTLAMAARTAMNRRAEALTALPKRLDWSSMSKYADAQAELDFIELVAGAALAAERDEEPWPAKDAVEWIDREVDRRMDAALSTSTNAFSNAIKQEEAGKARSCWSSPYAGWKRSFIEAYGA